MMLLPFCQSDTCCEPQHIFRNDLRIDQSLPGLVNRVIYLYAAFSYQLSSFRRHTFDSHRVNTVLPLVRPSTMARNASLASSMGITAPISGLIPALITRRIMLFISSSVPIIEPMTVILSLTRRSTLALGSAPEDTPTATTVPPARTD